MKRLYYAIFFLLALSLQNSVAAKDGKSAEFTPTQTKEIEKIVHDYLLKNPKILRETSKKLKELEQAEEQTKIEANIAKYKKEIFNDKGPGRLVLGNPQGKIIIAEFTQHQCPSCKSSAIILHELVKSNPEIKLIVIYWPFLGGNAIHTAKSVLAAEEQNKGAELNHAIFAHEESITKDKLDPVIKSIKDLDDKKLSSAIENKKHDKGLSNNFNLAQKLGLTGTPAIIFTNKEMTKFSLVPGKTPHFEEDLDKALKDVS